MLNESGLWQMMLIMVQPYCYTFKLTSGENILGLILKEDASFVHIRYPMLMKMISIPATIDLPQQEVEVGVPWMASATAAPISIRKENILVMQQMNSIALEIYVQLVEKYDFGFMAALQKELPIKGDKKSPLNTPTKEEINDYLSKLEDQITDQELNDDREDE